MVPEGTFRVGQHVSRTVSHEDHVFFFLLQSFYRKRFDTEEDRVNELFLKADSKGVSVKKR